jgi:PAS domain S-box-containing protein
MVGVVRSGRSALENELSRIVATLPGLAWTAGPDGSVEFLSERWCAYTGLRAEDARGANWLVAAHPDDLERLKSYWVAILESGGPGEIEVRLRRFDGRFRWFLIRAEPQRDASGAIAKWYGLNTDIEDRKHAEEELRRSEALLAEAQRLSSTGSFSWFPEFQEINWSGEVYRIFELDPAEHLTLERIGTRVHPDDVHLIDELVASARLELDVEYEHRLLLPGGRVKYLHLIAHARRDSQNRVEYIGAVQDVTERRLAEEALAKTRSELARAARVMSFSALTASIAHEVNQPLAGIITNASTSLRMLAADPPNLDGARETARRTIRDANRASEVIQRLRALFQKGDIAIEAVDLNEAALEVLALSSRELQRSHVILRTDLADDLPLVRGDRVQLQQVIMNLLLNAADALNTVVDRLRLLTIRTERDGSGHVRLSVQDAGVGFAPGVAERLFEPLYTTKTSGMGMGLSVSRSIVESHQGRIWAEPNEVHGVTFAFTVPRAFEPGAS